MQTKYTFCISSDTDAINRSEIHLKFGKNNGYPKREMGINKNMANWPTHSSPLGGISA